METITHTETDYTAVARLYTERLNALYEQITLWLNAERYKLERGTIELEQLGIGKYTAPMLTITDIQQSEVIATLKPAGALVIASEGRVEVMGTLDENYLVFLLPKSGIPLEVTTSKANAPEMRKSFVMSVYSDVHTEGWYRVEIRSSARVKLVDKELFEDILREVSPDEILTHA
jgi:hypothetical protein